MPIDDLTALGQKMREARKKKDLTQQELADLSHVSVKQIANIEKGKMNPSYLILRALAKVLHISLDTLINPDVSLEDEGVNQMKMLYSSCPPEMRDTQLHHTQEMVKELTELSEKFEMIRGKQAPLNTEFHSVAARSANAFDQLTAGRGLFLFQHPVLPPFSALDLHLPLPLKAPAFPHGNAGTRHRSFSFLPAISRTPSATL